MKRNLPTVLVALLTFVLIQPAGAQISVGGDDFLALIGSSQALADTFNTDTGITVDVGSAGENQTWDFSALNPAGPSSGTRAYLDPADTPFAADFPSANLVLAFFAIVDTVETEFYEYNFVDASGLTELGGGLVVSDTSYFEEVDVQRTVDLPVSYNSTWVDRSVDTTSFGQSVVITRDSVANTIDAWGSLSIPVGTFDVLRIRSNDVSISDSYFNDILIQSDTSRSIEYQWLSKDNFVLLSVRSPEGVTDPDFSTAQGISVVTTIGTTSIDSPGLETASLMTVFPNPSNAVVMIDLEPTSRSSATVEVYNVLGQSVRTVASFAEGQERSVVVWDGNDSSGKRVAAGSYFIRVVSAGTADSKRVVMVD